MNLIPNPHNIVYNNCGKFLRKQQVLCIVLHEEEEKMMRFIRSWSYSCAKYLSNKLNESHEKRRIYYFGFQVILGAVFKGILLVIISLLLRIFVPAMIVVAVFGSLRMLAGGYHMNTYTKCMFVSLALFISAALLSRYTYQYWTQWSLIILAAATFIISIPVLLKWAPADNPNRPITKPEEIRKFKFLSIVYMIIWSLVITTVIWTEPSSYQIYIIAASLGVLLELFTISPTGQGFFHKISGSVDHIKLMAD